MNKPIITAHSGCEGTGIDTIESIEKALEFGADAVEIDIRMDPLGELRISHDPLSLEDYFRKNPLMDVFQMVQPTSLLINFDIKEKAALYKTIDAAHNFGFPMERLIFSGSTAPDQLTNDDNLSRRANFYLNLEEVLKYIYVNRKDEFRREVFLALMEDPFIILIDEDSAIPAVYLSEAIKLRQKIYAISKTLQEKIYEDTIRIYQETMAAAANLPKFLLYTQITEFLKEGNIPLSIWTVDEPELIQRCIETGVYNITTRKIRSVKQILDRTVF